MFNWSGLQSQTYLKQECDVIITILELIKNSLDLCKPKLSKKNEIELFEAWWFCDTRNNNWKKWK